MATKHKVHYIDKRGNHYAAHARISHLGGFNSDGTRWKMTEDDAIKAIEDKKYEFFATVNFRSVSVIVAEHNGRKYLKTETDGYSPDNLLALPECP